MPKGVLLLATLALTVAGCASGLKLVSPTLDGAGRASPPTVQMPDCRNSGSYNRAANLCVSNGP